MGNELKLISSTSIAHSCKLRPGTDISKSSSTHFKTDPLWLPLVLTWNIANKFAPLPLKTVQIHINFRFLLVKYEDLAESPKKETKRIYNFLGLPFTRFTEKMLFEHTVQILPSGMFNLYGTYRNSQTRPHRWKTELSWDIIDAIQKSCSYILKKLEYKIFQNPGDMMI